MLMFNHGGSQRSNSTSVAYNFMVADNSGNRRYSDHNSTVSTDPRRCSSVALDVGAETPSTSLTKRRRSRKKSTSGAGSRERLPVKDIITQS